jgi:hypothetical protein
LVLLEIEGGLDELVLVLEVLQEAVLPLLVIAVGLGTHQNLFLVVAHPTHPHLLVLL